MSLKDKIHNIIPHDLKSIDREITVYHLLTHTSGIGDYLDEENINDPFDVLKLYDTRPVHKWESLEFYLPMFNELPRKFDPGARYGYSNAGFILRTCLSWAVRTEGFLHAQPIWKNCGTHYSATIFYLEK